ncbi:MAG: 3-deoxy-D-manno-octulosonic acid transferase [Deltaproteobacteria bacterium]|nr:3-deoxy-D-manno-octulosonic acid transferase [Deltaproteobacteria bacterium]
MLRILYDILLHAAFVVTLPYFTYKAFTAGKYRQGIKERFGFISEKKLGALRNSRFVWMHAVSVGETRAVLPLLKLFKERHPEFKILFSTVTMTGNAVAKTEGAAIIDVLIYYPFDFFWVISRVLGKARPEAFIVAEKEIWPNMIAALKCRNIPIMVINGSISERSFKRYKFFGFFLRRAFESLSLFSAQTGLDAQRAIELGAPQKNTFATGNIKFDMKPKAANRAREEEIMRSLGIAAGDIVLTAGSTHPGEEKLILQAHETLKREFPELKLIIAPRHPERFSEVASLLSAGKIPFARRSRGVGSEKPSISLLDTLGELGIVYSFSTIAFVGGSLVNIGGHNLLEPAFFSRPVIFGPYVKSYKQMAEELAGSGGGFLVNTIDDLIAIAGQLLRDKALYDKAGKAAHDFVVANSGTATKTLDLMDKLINGK